MTSRSFSVIIKKLEGDFRLPILPRPPRLDTIKGDMILSSAKQLLIRNFPTPSATPGSTYTDSGPDEKDHQLLVEYNVVVSDLAHLRPAYRGAILGIATTTLYRRCACLRGSAASRSGAPFMPSPPQYASASLDYLRLFKNQSVFSLVAILATIDRDARAVFYESADFSRAM
ncbi:hypothetical protein B0H19DRAFT_1252345 [Mycena capillaripes]|nr:hypothetical protein B0H19DRAFT_1252345 [Mycena capillaripes]